MKFSQLLIFVWHVINNLALIQFFSIQYMIERCPLIHTLVLDYCSGITEKTIEMMTKCLPALTLLGVKQGSDQDKVTIEKMQQILNSHPISKVELHYWLTLLLILCKFVDKIILNLFTIIFAFIAFIINEGCTVELLPKSCTILLLYLSVSNI